MSRYIFLLIILFAGINGYSQIELTDSIVSKRLEYLKVAIKKDSKISQTWWEAWLFTYNAATFGQGAIAGLSNDKILKQDMILGAATTALGAAGQIISPFIPNDESRFLLDLPENNAEERKIKLVTAEDYLKRQALLEKKALRWHNHILPTTVNLTSGLITWLGFKRSVWAGVGNFALNTAITEFQIWTQPKKAIKNYDTYCKFLEVDSQQPSPPELSWIIKAHPYGASLIVVF